MSQRKELAQVAAALLVHVVGLAFVARVELSADVAGRFLPDDPALVALLDEQELFGANEWLAILVEWDGATTRPDARDLASRLAVWRDELATLPGVADVYTVLDVPAFEWSSPGRWAIRRIGERPDPMGSAWRNPIARKGFLRADGRGTLILVSLATGSMSRLDERFALRARLDDWIASQDGRYRLTAVGALPFQLAAIDAAVRDIHRVWIPLVVAMLAILALSFRPFSAAVLLVGTAGLNAPTTLGLSALLGWSLSQFSLIALALVLTVGLLDNVHLAHAYCRLRADGAGRDRAARQTVVELAWPCFWTTVTTIAGFSALLVSSVPQVRQFGALAALGTAIAFVTSFTLLPVGLRLLDPRLGRLRWRMAGNLWRRRGPAFVIASVVVLLAVTLPGLLRLHIVADYPRLFPDDHPITRGLEEVEAHWGGVANVSFLLKAKADSGVSPVPSVEAVRRLSDFVRLLAQRELVTSVLSPVDLLAIANAEHRTRFGTGLTDDDVASIVDGLAKAGDARVRSLERRWIDPRSDVLRITARVRMMRPDLFPTLARDLEGFRSNLADLFDVELGGWPLAYKNLEARLLRDLVESFLIAFAVVGLLLAVALRSLALWIIAIIANLAPIAIVLGALGLAGGAFSSGLLLAPAIALGLVVDDTIHLLLRLLRERREQGGEVEYHRDEHGEVEYREAEHGEAERSVVERHQDERDATPDATAALVRAIDRVGPALTITSVTLATGFAALWLSEFRGNRLLAGVLIAVVGCAWLADLVLVPALLVVLAKRRGRAGARVLRSLARRVAAECERDGHAR